MAQSDQISQEHLPSAGSSEVTRDGIDDVLLLSDGGRLSIGEDHLEILSNRPYKQERARCCGLLPSTATGPRTILYRDILWAETSSSAVSISFVKTISKAKIRPATESFPITENDVKQAQSFVQKLTHNAYGSAQPRRRVKVIINPFGGKGKALKYWVNEIEPIFKAAKCEIDVVQTTHSAHAEEISEALDINEVDVVACCSGDGVPYEVWNGLARKKNAQAALAKVAVVQLPCGTGNALSFSCNGTSSASRAALAVVKSVPTRIDLASITQGDRRTLSFLSQSLGIVAESDLATEDMRWLGDMRFTVGFLKRLFRKTVWPCDIAIGVEVGDKNTIEADYRRSMDLITSRPPPKPASTDDLPSEDEGLPPLRYGSITSPLPDDWTLTPFPNLGNLYAGNLPFMAADANFFSFARIDDGMLDFVNIRGDISMHKSIAMMLSVGEGTLWKNPDVTYRKVSGFRVIPHQREGYISVDGERYPFEPFQVEVHKGLGCTLTPKGRFVGRDEIV